MRSTEQRHPSLTQGSLPWEPVPHVPTTCTRLVTLELSHQLFRGLAGTQVFLFPFLPTKPRCAFLTPEAGPGVPEILLSVTCILSWHIQGSATKWWCAVTVFIRVIITETS